MKYKSTRGGSSGASFEEALFAGYASDGGIYVPATLPKLSPELVNTWKESPPSYQQVVFEIVKLFVSEDELPRNVLERCIEQAYAQFDIESVVGLKECKGGESLSDCYTVVELFHGRTKSFKDYSMSLVGRLMEYFVGKRKSQVTALVGTSGDTGSAAIEAVKGLEGIDIIVLYPKGKISEVQELQMITVLEDNVHVFQTEGTSDDLDVPIKQSFPAPGLLTLNSFNWARVMIQIAHHIYLCTLERCQPIDIYVPTGGAGNFVGGLLASLLGFPINLYCAQNDNNNVETLINKGMLSYGDTVLETYANAMDIRTPYNVERLLYFLSDSPTVAEIMKKVESNLGSQVEIPKDLIEKVRQVVKGAIKVDTPTTLDTIVECWNSNKYLVCPHTAVAVAFFHSNRKANENLSSSNKAYIIATASPEKFAEAAKAAKIPDNDILSSGGSGKLLDELRARQKKEPKLMAKGQDWYQILQDEIKLTQAPR